MVTGVGQGQSAENGKKVKIPMDSNHHNNNDQNFLSIYHISGTESFIWIYSRNLYEQILRDVLFLFSSV